MANGILLSAVPCRKCFSIDRSSVALGSAPELHFPTQNWFFENFRGEAENSVSFEVFRDVCHFHWWAFVIFSPFHFASLRHLTLLHEWIGCFNQRRRTAPFNSTISISEVGWVKNLPRRLEKICFAAENLIGTCCTFFPPIIDCSHSKHKLQSRL